MRTSKIHGPILFLIYIIDSPNSSDYLLPTLFTDDTSLSISRSNYDEIVPVLNRELNLIKNWTISNKLSINVEKTETITISNRVTNHSNTHIMLDSEFIQFFDSCMFLGVKLDNKKNFINHIKHVSNKLSKNTGIFYRIKDCMNTQARLNFYYSFYLSISII